MKEIFTKTNQEQGFTLVELMIVIAIIGILAAIAIPNFLSYQRKGYDAAAQSEAMNFLHATMNHFADQGTVTPISVDKDTTMKGFSVNTLDFAYDGQIVQDTDGGVTGAVTINHVKSSQKFIVNGSSARVTKP